MTRYIVTTGISLRESSRCWKGLDPTKTDWTKEPDCKKWGELRGTAPTEYAKVWKKHHKEMRWLIEQMSDKNTRERQARKLVEQLLDRDAWLDEKQTYRLPAELATIRKMSKQGIFKPEDEIVILFGKDKDPWLDNPDSTEPQGNQIDALLCQAALEFVIEKARTIPNNTWHIPSDVKVLPAEPVAWDPTRTSEFLALFNTVADKQAWIRKLLENHSTHSSSPHFILTGGYKGLLMGISMWAAIKCWTSKIYYMHERNEEVVELPVNAMIPPRPIPDHRTM